MSSDYHATAQALALPISPLGSSSLDHSSTRPAWSERISSRSRRDSSLGNAAYRDRFLRSADQVQQKIRTTFTQLTILQRCLAVFGIVGILALGIVFLVFNERFFQMLIPVAEKWRDISGGWLILWAITFIAAFPPMIGYSSTVTIAGFLYGFPNGWYIAASATVIGSTCAFLTSRTILSGYVHRLVGQDKRFEALALTLKHDGLKILCMIRFCPLPYSLSNASMATFPTIHPLSFAIATLVSTPKLLIPIFIGSRMASIAEGGESMKTSTKALNYASILFGVCIGGGVGYIIYQRTIARARELEIENLEGGDPSKDLHPAGGAYTDHAADADAGTLMDDEDISLWHTGENAAALYRDDLTDDVDVFASGDADDHKGVLRL